MKRTNYSKVRFPPLFFVRTINHNFAYFGCRSKPKEEDPYDGVSAPPSAMGDFQNPLYGTADPNEVDNTRVASSTNSDVHYCTPRPSTEGAGALPVSPPSYTESQIAAIAIAHGDDDIKKTKLDSVSDDNDYDDVFTADTECVKVPLE